ncbi:hypothetical protein [Pseudonocardia sp. DLS-67]
MNNDEVDDYLAAQRSFAAAVAFMAAQPGGPERTLGLHRRRADGYCTGCMHTLSRWPCTVARIALGAVAGRN